MPAFQGDRKLVEVFNLTGGLNTAGDPSSMEPNEWRDCQNMMVARPQIGIWATNPTYDATCVSSPSLSIINNTVINTFSYGQPYKTLTLATGQNSVWPSETWTAGGAGTQSYQNTFSYYMNQCVQQLNAASQSTTSTITISAMKLTLLGNLKVLALDTNWTNNSNFSSGYIRVGSDSSNYYQFNIVSPGIDGNSILTFTWASPSSTVGTPLLNSISYIQVSTTASSGGSFTFQFNNLRLGALSNSSTLINASGNIRDCFMHDSKADTSAPYQVLICGDTVFMASAGTPTSNFVAIASKFTNWNQIPPGPHGFRFNFAQMPDYKNSNPNNMVLYFVNGTDGYFSYNVNASSGSAFSRISSTAYRYIQNFKNYMMLAGRPDKPNELDWSDLNDPSNLSTLASGNITIPQVESGQGITGLMPFDDYMFLFRLADVYIFSGNTNNDFALRKTKSKVGAIDQKYICKAGMQVFFAHYGGIYSLNWWDESNLISKKISNLLNPTNDIRQYLTGFLIYNPLREILLMSIPGDITNDPVTSFSSSYRLTFSIPQASYGGNIQGGAWGKLGQNSTSDSLSFCALYYSGQSIQSSLANYFPPFFYEFGVNQVVWDGSRNDISMTYMIRTAWHTCGHPKIFKNFDNAGFWVRTQSSLSAPTTPTIKDYYGFSDTATNTYSAGTTPSGGYAETLLQPNRAQAISLQIQAVQTGQTVDALQVSGYTFTWTQDGVI